MSTRLLTRPTVIAASVVAALAPAVALMGPAQALTQGCGGGATLTAHVSDSTPASGQRFAVHGKLEYFGMSSAGYVVKVQTYRQGAWTPITGARVRTNDNGHYRIGLVLDQTGNRRMRVVAVGKNGDSNMHQKFRVTVG